MRVTVGTVAIWSIAAAGLAAWWATSNDPHAFSGVRIKPEPSLSVSGTDSLAKPKLAQRLEEGRHALAIRADQLPAWRRFADVLGELERSGDAFADRAVRGLASEAERDQERAKHAVALAVAIGDLTAVLSPEQARLVRRLLTDLRLQVICTAIEAPLRRQEP